MKRIFIFVVTCSALMIFFTISAGAFEENTDTYSEEFDFGEITDTLDSDTLRILEEIGISELSFESIFSISPNKIFEALFNITATAAEKPLKFFLVVLGVLIITSLISSFTDNKKIVSLVGSGATALSLCVPIAELTRTSFSVLEALLTFTAGFAGVFCGIVSSSGNISLGVTYGTLTVFCDTVFSSLLVNLSQPVVNALCSLGFLSCFDFYGFSQKLSGIVKKLYVFVLSLVGTVFSGLVTLKGVLGGSADSLTARGVRFVIGQSLPVVGGAVSETFTTLTQSLSLIKNTVGVFGIITVIVFVMPTVLELLAWVLVLELCSTAATAYGSEDCNSLLSVLKDALVLLISTTVILTVVFIVSVGVAIAARVGDL